MNAELRIRAMSPADIPAVLALAESLATAPHWPQGTYEFALNPANLPERIALLAEVRTGRRPASPSPLSPASNPNWKPLP